MIKSNYPTNVAVVTAAVVEAAVVVISNEVKI